MRHIIAALIAIAMFMPAAGGQEQSINKSLISLASDRNIAVVSCWKSFASRRLPCFHEKRYRTGAGVNLGNHLVLTAYHVAKYRRVEVDDGEAEIIAVDPGHDLALLRSNAASLLTKIPPLVLSNNVNHNDLVFGVGNPFQNNDRMVLGYALNHISFFDWNRGCIPKECDLDKNWRQQHPSYGKSLLVSTEFIDPGFSGGGQWNSRGEMVGIYKGTDRHGNSVSIGAMEINNFLRKNGIEMTYVPSRY
jgi:S1-C subfamily serine protease